ncbi:hypothetical protein ASPZODRAFT_16270 [Penicilliopsis zonata CBS 506.65]|uniref:Uncharacterized protein n=1 Tax=Penicilliopsis zonata CBS 506.65 TaxID=1073090 RepID=A0A1L9SGY5_9EURO|nr:hypothetical protein ASPZODRAFT_16270 [Penicilliopsis zonata CBS 506.65]OJJ46510.1 hypothetical protein ASPZODRAFT_16270 [Penicilliopsis zonata CBS 506.65]
MRTRASTRRQREQRLIELRDEYYAAAEAIEEAMSLDIHKQAYLPHELSKLGHGVDLLAFDPLDQHFLDSKGCLFRPLPEDIMKDFFMDPSQMDEVGGSFEWPPSSENDLRGKPHHAAQSIFSYLRTRYRMLKKSPDFYLSTLTKWDFIDCDDDFHTVDGEYKTPLSRQLRCWYLFWMQYYTEDEPLPHLQFIMAHDAVGKEGELLPGELGPIIKGIYGRLEQEDF